MRSLTTEYPEHFRYYDILVSAFVAVLLVSNIVAPKLIDIGPFRLSGAQLLFPLTYIFGDIFTEVYGYAGSRRAIWNGFFASALMAVISMAIVALPASPGWPHQEAYATVLGFLPRLVAASLAAYWAGEFVNSYTMAKLKLVTRGRHLWMRTIGSTAVGQLVDTVLVMVLAFGGVMRNEDLIRVIVSGYLAKVLYEAAATPLTYLVVNGLKRAEGVDILDSHTDFNPFRARLSAK
ncbi:MAG TPA: queuosine precursor transporter [Bryobacteraceae bacterium]|nr:queuosine precursor transporter [Bryobacteraceae bacterium]